jgi:small conductance mechanosensitive channel
LTWINDQPNFSRGKKGAAAIVKLAFFQTPGVGVAGQLVEAPWFFSEDFRMRAIEKCGAAALLLICGLLVMDAGIVQAQEAASEPGFAEQAEALDVEIRALVEDAEDFRRRAEAAEGDFARILRRRSEEAGLAAIGKVHDLARLVIDREAEGQDAAPWRARVTELLEGMQRGLQDYLESVLGRAAPPDASADEAGPADLAAQEDSEAELYSRILRLEDALITNLELSRELGLEVAAQESFIERSLTESAQFLSLSLEEALEQRERIARQLAVLPDDADLAAKQRLADQKVQRLAGNLTAASDMLGTIELENAPYKQQLIQVTGAVTTDIFDWDVFKGLASDWFGDFGQWIADNLPQFLFKLLVFLFILWVALWLSRLTRRLVTEGLNRSKLNVSQLLQRMIVSTAAGLVLLLGLLFGLAQLGISVGPALAGLGIAGFIVGFALQDTLGNFASGMMILLYRPYDVGDLIEAGGVFGKVSSMSLVNTTVLTVDNQTLVVPNSKIWGDVIKNVTAQNIRRVDMVFGIGYSDDIPKAEKVLTEILGDHEKVLEDPASVVRLHTLNESSVDFIVRPWVKTEDYWDVYWDVTRAVKMRFDEEDISIPFPQRDVHFFSGDEKSLAAIAPAQIEQRPVDWKGTDAPDTPDASDAEGGESVS